MFHKICYSLLGFFFCTSLLQAQRFFENEVGAFAGATMISSDYGAKGDLDSTLKNTGVGVGLVHYMNFAENAYTYRTKEHFLWDHFKVRNEVSFAQVDMKHYGNWVAPNKISSVADQLRAMRGSTSVINIGSQIEFYILSIKDFGYTKGALAPYISGGFLYSLYTTKSTSTLGNLGDPTITPPKYIGGFRSESSAAFAFTGSVGLRYKINKASDVLVELKSQFFTSDWIDGINPNREIYPENKTNDYLTYLNFGYIYYLD